MRKPKAGVGGITKSRFCKHQVVNPGFQLSAWQPQPMLYRGAISFLKANVGIHCNRPNWMAGSVDFLVCNLSIRHECPLHGAGQDYCLQSCQACMLTDISDKVSRWGSSKAFPCTDSWYGTWHSRKRRDEGQGRKNEQVGRSIEQLQFDCWPENRNSAICLPFIRLP